MNLLKNNNKLLKFSGTWTADSLLITRTAVGPDIGWIRLTNIPTWLFDSPESVLVAEIQLDRFGFNERTKKINLTAITGTTVIVTVTYSYNGNQSVSGITASLDATLASLDPTPATIQYEKLIGFDQP